jgi:hypothetical protein
MRSGVAEPAATLATINTAASVVEKIDIDHLPWKQPAAIIKEPTNQH